MAVARYRPLSVHIDPESTMQMERAPVVKEEERWIWELAEREQEEQRVRIGWRALEVGSFPYEWRASRVVASRFLIRRYCSVTA